MTTPRSVYRCGNTAVWSTLRLAAGENPAHRRYPLFSTARGYAGQGFDRALGKAETNLIESNHMPGGLAIDVKDVCFEVVGHAADLPFLSRAVWTWDFLQVEVDGGSVSELTTYDKALIEWVEAPITWGPTLPIPAYQQDRDITTQRTEPVPPLAFEQLNVPTPVGFRGAYTYRDYAVAIPANTRFGAKLYMPNEEHAMVGDAYVRILLRVAYSQAIHIG